MGDPTTGLDKLRQSPPPIPAPETTDTPSGLVDTPPKGGVFKDWDGAQLDPDTVAEGNLLGRHINPDDDDDNGLT